MRISLSYGKTLQGWRAERPSAGVYIGGVGSGSLNGVLDGKHYNRALRTHKVSTSFRHYQRYFIVTIIITDAVITSL